MKRTFAAPKFVLSEACLAAGVKSIPTDQSLPSSIGRPDLQFVIREALGVVVDLGMAAVPAIVRYSSIRLVAYPP